MALGLAIARAMLFAAFVAVSTIAILRGAAAQRADSALVRGDGGKIRIIINPSGTQGFPAMLVQKFGLDKKHNFQAEIIPTANTQAEVIGIQSGNAEIGIWNWPDVARMHGAGTPVVGIAPSMKWTNTLIVPINSPAMTLADLKGKRIGILRRTGLDWVLIRAVAQKVYGFNIDVDARIQEATVALLRALIEQGQLDAAMMYGDLTPAMVATGKFRLLTTIKDLVGQLGIPDAPYSLVAARLDYAAQHPQNIKAFLSAYREAVDTLLTDDSIWLEEAKDLLKISDPNLVAQVRDRTRPLYVSSFTAGTEADIRRTFDILLATGGPVPLGMSRLPDGFITTAYQ
jgi:NitT/TauT family transport system substrate-binding protein